MRVLRTAFASAAVALLSCNAVRPAKRPAEDVEMTVTHARAPLPDDCRVRIIDGGCTVKVDAGELRTDCPRAPPAELQVGHLRVCSWNRGEMADVNRQVCRAGGNAIMTEVSLTDSCTEETLDGVSGTAMTLYEVYRLPP
jgi:hypothetical protein